MEIEKINTGINLFDNGTFEQMSKIAHQLALSSLIPDSLKTEGNKDNKKNLPIEVVTANCFRIVEQAQRWGMSPFAVIDCASVVHGKLMWEGKLVHAALEAMLGIRLDYRYEGSGMSRKVIVSGQFKDEANPRTVEGTVGIWKTDQWQVNAYDQRLAYRGAREWARRHAPSVLLGVYTDDEFEPSKEPRNVTPVTVSKTPENPFHVAIEEKEREPLTPYEKSEKLVDPNPKTIAPQGKQKKKRNQRDVEFLDISEKTIESSGKRFWVVAMNIGQKNVDMVTFSESLAAALEQLEFRSKIRVTFTVNKSGYALEDYVMLEEEDEGGIA